MKPRRNEPGYEFMVGYSLLDMPQDAYLRGKGFPFRPGARSADREALEHFRRIEGIEDEPFLPQ